MLDLSQYVLYNQQTSIILNIDKNIELLVLKDMQWEKTKRQKTTKVNEGSNKLYD